jgi:hypothetical protein
MTRGIYTNVLTAEARVEDSDLYLRAVLYCNYCNVEDALGRKLTR